MKNTKKTISIASKGRVDEEQEVTGIYKASVSNMPRDAKAKFDRLKKAGKVRGTFSDYIIDSVLMRLKKEK